MQWHLGRLPPVDAHALSKFSSLASRLFIDSIESLLNLDTGPDHPEYLARALYRGRTVDTIHRYKIVYSWSEEIGEAPPRLH